METNLNSFWFQLLGFLLFASLGGLTVYGLNVWHKSAARTFIDEWLAKVGFPVTMPDVERFVIAVVAGIEQQFGKVTPDGPITNPDKKDLATTALQGFLAGTVFGQGGKLELDSTTQSLIIESAVRKLKNNFAPEPATKPDEGGAYERRDY